MSIYIIDTRAMRRRTTPRIGATVFRNSLPRRKTPPPQVHESLSFNQRLAEIISGKEEATLNRKI